MAKLTSDEIIKVLDMLIGPVEAYGDSAIDKTRKENLENLLDITDWCLDQIWYSSMAADRKEASMVEIGQRGKQYLNGLGRWIKSKAGYL